MKKLNNKGAALVSVMIAITFISIVATTLLVISLNNYQMKVVNSQSKANFYETEQRINVVTAGVRNAIPGSTDVNSAIGTLVNGDSGVDYSGASFAYKANKIAELAFPGATVTSVGTNATVSSDGDTFYFYPGTVSVTQRTNGKQVTINDVTIKQVADSKGGYENTIKTDINFYIEISQGGGASGGVGSCSFLLDNTIRMEATDKACRVNIAGNCIMGDYEYINSGSYQTSYNNNTSLATPQTLTKFSKPASVTKTKTGDTVSSVSMDDSSTQKAVICLDKVGVMNFNSDNNVIIGDIYLKDASVLNVLDGGTFTVYGDIFVADKSAFICSGDLKLGHDCNVYKVNSGGVCEKITTSDKSKNVIFKSVSHLSKENYDKLACFLNLFDDKGDNDGILPKIIKKAGTGPNYFYETKNAYQTVTGTLCTFNGKAYKAEYPPANFNGGRSNELIFVTDNLEGSQQKVFITQHVPDCTILSRRKVVAYDTHNICVSCMGDQAFNYIRTHSECKIAFDSGSGSQNISIGDFFDTNCDSYVNTVFSLGVGDTGSTPVPTRTAIGFSDWIKE